MFGSETKPLLRALAGEAMARPPWWLMRQAGRYLPEYRELRAKAPDFVGFCLNPKLASEATLQPVRRFDMDGAILFADILLVPLALGQKLEFGEEGPALEPISDGAGVLRLNGKGLSRLDSVYETVRCVRAGLSQQTALIGFAGSPWTVAIYMVEGGASRDFARAKGWAYRDPDGFSALIELLIDSTVTYLSGQIEAGAEAVQLFDSWAGVLNERGFERWVIDPTKKIVHRLKERFPTVPVIGFPRGAGVLYHRYAEECGVDAVSLDTSVPLGIAYKDLPARVTLQGNLDPIALLLGGSTLQREVRAIRAAVDGRAFVFNLGHGVLPQTPPQHVAALARLLAEPREP